LGQTSLAADYCKLTGKPLGVTGEVAECMAAEILGLALAPPRDSRIRRNQGHAAGQASNSDQGRAFGEGAKPGQRLGTIKPGAPCDIVILFLLDNGTLETREIWEAPIAAMEERLAFPGSKARGALRINEFKRLARLIWPLTATGA
jgi:hypothetical protein